MTTSDNNRSFRYEGNGVTDTFSFPSRIFTTGDIVVEIITRATDVLVETLTISTDYTVTITGDETASVQVTNAAKIPSTLQDIQLRSSLAKTQTVDLPSGTVFPAKSVEDALDRVTVIVQEVSEDINRSVKLSSSSSLSNIVLPNPVASEVIGWNAAADNLTTYSFSEVSATLDAVFIGLASGDLLQYNGTNWVNTTTLTSDITFDGIIDVTNINAATSAGGSLRTSGGTSCISWGGGGSANSTLGGNMSGASAYKLTNMIDPTSAQDYATKAYVDNNGGGLVLLGSYTASADTSVDIGSGLDLDAAIDGTYDEYIATGIDVVAATDNTNAQAQTSANGGSSFDATGYAWGGIQITSTGSGTVSATVADPDTKIVLGTNCGNAAGESFNFIIKLFKPSSSTFTKMSTEFYGTDNNGDGLFSVKTGQRNSAAAVNAVRILMSSGNITSGTFYLYGVRKT